MVPTLVLPVIALAAVPRAIVRILKGVNEAVWKELNDPANFVVQSLLLLGYREESPNADVASTPFITRVSWLIRRLYLISGAIQVALALVLPLVLASDTGDELIYAVTILIGGLFTLIPGQVAAVRNRDDIATSHPGKYPTTLRKCMWLGEAIFAAASAVALFVFTTTKPPWGPIAWGVLAVTFSELVTVSAIFTSAVATETLEAMLKTSRLLRYVKAHE